MSSQGSPRARRAGEAANGSQGSARAESAAERLKRFVEFVDGTGREPSGLSYYLILGTALALTAIGLLMVLSSSAVESIAEGESPFGLFLKQGIFAVVGVVLMLVLSRFSVARFKALAWPALGLSLLLLLLVFTPLGIDVNGNRNWIQLGPGMTGQPSEAAKLGLSLWMANVLVRKAHLLHQFKHVLVPVGAVAGLVVLLVMAGNDLGTTMIILLIVAGALFIAGVPMKFFAMAGGAVAAVVLLLALTNSNRLGRITVWLDQSCEDTTGLNMQSCNGLFALASGGWWGVGLGQSRQKYSWIPEAHNDYIFAIIGEELGLLGTFVVLALFGILAIALVRTVLRQPDPFVRILAGAIMVWIIGQAFVNIGVVTGLLPVIGVPLPFISYGGSALTITLAAVGVLLSFARPARKTARA
ncbi:putative lipid II flippase FtsW [Arthrobacter mobilis]|uniref:Probable peptidoglycan glycosyltransferase FtsW n=1 Tax=Arthrobacter mobilis TaxID=2724944 RepID=A0A7X6HD54_9MICC|nr:putative lipid II flippase FtsW [Arthrobacter mobilis]NKX54943.1 putative lipid II flippase FtsW [Arthrobacter mobilis]